MATAEQFVGLSGQMNEILKRVGNGSLNPDGVKASLQQIIEGRFKVPPPKWWRTPEQQLERAHQFWPDTALPDPPKQFDPATDTEVLLLHVPDNLCNNWERITDIFQGRDTLPWNFVGFNPTDLCPAPYHDEFAAPIWLAFDPEHGRGKHPRSLLGRKNLAGSEVLSAIIQFPGWVRAWIREGTTPSLGGYHIEVDQEVLGTPFLSYWEKVVQLGVCSIQEADEWVDDTTHLWTSPSVRKC